MQVRGKTLLCFSVILAFSKSLHETCRLLRARTRTRAADFFLFTGGLPRFDSTPGFTSVRLYTAASVRGAGRARPARRPSWLLRSSRV
jgi:hypothetical protein